MTDTQAESTAMLTVLDDANRKLRAAWRAKGWQAGMVLTPGRGGRNKAWGSWVIVFDGESTVLKVWSPFWLEAIETALDAALLF